MGSDTIKKQLEVLKSENKYDEEFIEELLFCNEGDLEGEIVAKKVIEIITKRYVESKKDRAERI